MRIGTGLLKTPLLNEKGAGRPGGRIDVSTLTGGLLAAYVLAVVVAQASSLVQTELAILLLLGPLIAVSVALRPAWLVLLLAATPPSLTSSISKRGMVLILVVTLIAQLAARGRLSLGWRSGMWPLVVIVLLAHVFTASVGGDAALAARGFLNLFTYMVLLGLTTYNASLSDDLNATHLVNAFLIGAVLTVALEGGQSALSLFAYGGDTGIASIGRNVAYVAAIGFSLSFARLLLPGSEKDRQNWALYLFATASFAAIVIQESVRAAWLSCLVVIFLVSIWTNKRRYWLVIVVAAVLVVSMPTVGERVLPGYREGIERAIVSGDFSTGRLRLWNALWPEVTSGLPFGHGYGYAFTLSPERLFGFETFVVEGTGQTFVYPHNDFLFWSLELGVAGFAALLAFWVQLVLAFRWLLRHSSTDRPNACALSGILVTAFIVQMVDNSFAIQSVGVWFLLAAGSIFGLAAARKTISSHPRIRVDTRASDRV